MCLATDRMRGAGRGGMEVRWYFVALVTAAIAISYFDRQTLPVAITAIQRNIPISNQQFSYLQTSFLLAYAALYAIGGRRLDRLGMRRGFMLIMVWWSVACMLHGLASGFMFLMGARFLLGMGEGGSFPAAARVIAEWIAPEERSTAMGIINAGAAVGSLLAPPLIGVILLTIGWRAVFFVAGSIGIAWVIWWMISYRGNTVTLSSNALDARLLAAHLSVREIVGMRSVQALVFAKFMSDSAWYFLLFWLPKYLYDARGFDIKHVSYYAWIPYAASGVGSFGGGYFSSRLLRSGSSLDRACKTELGLSAAFMPAVPLVPVQLPSCFSAWRFSASNRGRG
jgi:ACS family hexuronate transporter-like MFS transporter